MRVNLESVTHDHISSTECPLRQWRSLQSTVSHLEASIQSIRFWYRLHSSDTTHHTPRCSCVFYSKKRADGKKVSTPNNNKRTKRICSSCLLRHVRHVLSENWCRLSVQGQIRVNGKHVRNGNNPAVELSFQAGAEAEAGRWAEEGAADLPEGEEAPRQRAAEAGEGARRQTSTAGSGR